jgi:hypothetical protein
MKKEEEVCIKSDCRPLPEISFMKKEEEVRALV